MASPIVQKVGRPEPHGPLAVYAYGDVHAMNAVGVRLL